MRTRKGIKAHRDVKPGNCLISGMGELKITDFGLASLVVPTDVASALNKQRPPSPGQLRVGRLTEAGFMLGTILHMAPEQIFDPSNVDARADIYSFGTMLFEMLTGKNPFFGQDLEGLVNCHLHVPVPALDKSLPKDLHALIQECTAKAAERRPANFQVVRNRLASVYPTITGKEILVSQAVRKEG